MRGQATELFSHHVINPSLSVTARTLYRFRMKQVNPDLRVRGVVHAARWYSLIMPPNSLLRCTGASSGTPQPKLWRILRRSQRARNRHFPHEPDPVRGQRATRALSATAAPVQLASHAHHLLSALLAFRKIRSAKTRRSRIPFSSGKRRVPFRAALAHSCVAVRTSGSLELWPAARIASHRRHINRLAE